MQIEMTRPANARPRAAAALAAKRTERPLISRRDLRRLVAQMVD